MPNKSEKVLPTRETATSVKQESIPTPVGKTEKRELRTETSKTFVHAEKSPDGKTLRTCIIQTGAVCYRDDTGELRSIDTTVRNLGGGVIGVEWAPYFFTLHPTGVGFDFTSRNGGTATIKLTSIGGEKFDDLVGLKPDIDENVITFKDVRPGCDIVFKCLNDRVKTLRILHDADAPRTFDWSVTNTKSELIDSDLVGADAAGNRLELASHVDGETIIETWNGLTQNDAEVVYPVEIDPTVTVNPAATNDDGYEFGGAWGNYALYIGYNGSTPIYTGVRFPSVAVAKDVTVTSATFGLQATGVTGTGGAGTLYGRAADNPGQFGNGADAPSTVSRSTASTSISAVGTTGAKTWTVTAIAQETLNRSGWVSGNAMSYLVIPSGSATNFTTFNGYEAGSSIPSLEITYTVPATVPILATNGGVPMAILCM